MVALNRFVPGADERVVQAERSVEFSVGVWDLEVNAGFLPEILDRLNKAQSVLGFEMVDAAVPRTISLGGESTLEWARQRLRSKFRRNMIKPLRQNVVADRLLPIGNSVRLRFGFDLLVVLTPAMIAFEHGNETHWNYFSLSHESVAIVSAADVREFAALAGRSFEAALAAMMITQILAQAADMRFHPENRGCLFDFNEERTSLVDTFRRMEIESSCLAKIQQPIRAATEAMIRELQRHGGGARTGPMWTLS